MFKKKFSTSNAHKLSGSDKKKLRKNLEKVYSGLDVEKLNMVLPLKSGELEFMKISSPHRGALYFQDGVAMVLDISGKGDLVPTVFSLWEVPDWLPRVSLKHFAVSKHILGGADVMLPGVNVPDDGFSEPFKQGDFVSVCVPGNPAPIAVGTAAMSSRDAIERVRASCSTSRKGKLVDLLHHYRDLLWQMHDGQPTPNLGFAADMVLPVDTDASLEDFQDENDGENCEEDSGSVEKGDESGVEGGEVGDEDVAGPSSNDNAGEINMDGLVEIALLQALHRSVKDNMLPIPAGILLQAHMVPNRYPGSTLDLKKTSFKKMSKFLQAYGAKGTKVDSLLSLREDKYTNETIVTRIDRSHIMYTGYMPYKCVEVPETTSSVGESGSNGAKGFSVEELYCPVRDLYPLLDAIGADRMGLYSAKEAGELGFHYIAHAGLDKGEPDNQHVVLDVILCDALFKGLLKKTERYPTHLKKSEVTGHVLKRMKKRYKIFRDGQEAIKQGQLPPVQISEERRQGNKKVTRIVGVETFLLSVPEFASACQKKFACSTTVDELPGKVSKGHELVVQGQRADEVAKYLITDYQIPKLHIQIKKLKKK